MPHLRSRHALTSLQSNLKYSPVVAIQGVRQCGKSTLARDLLPHGKNEQVYRTFDRPSVLDSALLRPESFLESLSDAPTAIIDEAQKAPKIFDAIKARVDLNRRPGQYLLLGSTEFSSGMKIRESLTGRLSRLRLFPLVISEAHSLAPSTKNPFFLANKARIKRKDVLKFLERGGMPGIFATRSDSEWNGQMEDWVSLTVERDALQIPTRKVDPVLLRRVLREIALNPEPEAGRIAKTLRLSALTVKSLLDVLKTLFVVHEISPHSSSTGKPRYYLCDPGICAWLGGSFERQLETWFYLETLARLAYSDIGARVEFSYYRSSKGSFIHGVWETPGQSALVKLLSTETIDERDLLILNATKEKYFSKASLYALGGTANPEKVNSVQVLPWECLG